MDHLYSALSNQVHGEGKQFSCPNCDRKYATASALRSHNSRRHAAHADVTYVCEKCGRTFDNRTQFSNHKSNAHGLPKTHPCPQCLEAFATEKGLAHHTAMIHVYGFHLPLCPFITE
jgi:predicted RNA-binding Zn-ribbon protein involved in translation (DUF1610 family)